MAVYTFPTEQVINWSAGTHTGVIGGIPTNYTQSGSTIPASSSDQAAVIQAALGSASAGTYVLLATGVHRHDAVITIPTGVELRGQDGAILEVHTANKAIYCGSDSDYNIGNAVGDVVTSGNTRGSTALTIASTAAYSAGQMIFIQAASSLQPDLPIIDVGGTGRTRSQMARVVSKTSTVLTITPPLHSDWSNVAITVAPFSAKSINAGLRNLTIECVNSTVIWGVQFEQTVDCWMYNVTIQNCSNYNAHLWHCLNTQIDHCTIGPLNHGGSNGAGLLIETACNCLVQNSILFDSFPNMELWNGGNVGNVFFANVYDITTGAGILDHNTTDGFNLYEANIASNIQYDGYFGTGYRQTCLRNWFHGIQTGIKVGGSVTARASVNRFNRYAFFIANRLALNTSYGNPNIGNASSTGQASPIGTQSTLTTRTSASVGTITAPASHGVTTGSTISVYWAEDVGGGVQVARIRTGVTVGTVSGTSIPISGGVGTDLPAQSSAIWVPTTNDSLRDWWAQYNASGSTITGTLTSRTDAATGTVTLSGTGTIISDNWPTSIRWTTGFRTQNTTGTVVGTSVPILGINNPNGDPLPAVSTAVTLYPGPNGFQELDLDCLVTTTSLGNYLVEEGGVPSRESLGGDTAPESLVYGAKPDWWGNLAWPFDPVGTTPNIESTPSGYRYENGVDPPTTGGNLDCVSLHVTNLVVGP